MQKNDQGFTLLELLTVLVVISIIATCTTISLSYLWQNAQSNTLRNAILQAIQLTRFSAVSHNEKFMLCKSADQTTCSGNWQQGFMIQSSAGNILQVFHFENHNGKIFSRFFPRGREALEFLPNGWPQVENGTFWYCVKHEENPRWAIIINRSGRAREVFPDREGIILDTHQQPLVC